MKHKSLITLLLALCCASLAEAQTTVTTAEAEAMTKVATYTETGIHDPSIVYNPFDKTYYIVGTHRGLGSTTDLVNISGLNNSNIYTTGYDTQFKSCPEHTVHVTRGEDTLTETLGSFDAGAFCATYAGVKIGDREPTTEASWISGDLWAPDVIYNESLQKWCLYLSLNGDNWASVIVMMTGDSPTGPFKYEAPIIFGGFNGQTYSGKSVSYKDTDLELVLGQLESLPSRYNTNAWGNLWPNCIDPCVFYDDEGELWMTYGSWSGGIFIIKLDKETGLRDYTYTYVSTAYAGTAPNRASYTGYTSDPYFGKLIAGGAYVSGEGSYVQKIGDYYYLFVTYGGLAPDGGYEMRIFRSSTPDGRYSDGTKAIATYTQYVLNYGKSSTTNRGLKIIGAMNNWGTMTVGETAEGHNSAIVDEDGDAFVVYHTKFNNGTAGFQVRVRQLFINDQGWPVASPFRFTGKQTTQKDIDAKQLFTPEEIAGDYSLLVHPYKLDHNNMEEAVPVKVTLTADGKITGAKTGKWEYTQEGKSYIKLTFDGRAYNGVALKQNVDGYASMPAVCITSVCNQGEPAWLYKYEPKAAVAYAYDRIVNKYLGSASSIIYGDAPVIDNVEVKFTTKNAETGDDEPETLTADGVFTPTADGHKISVIVEIQCGDYSMSVGPIVRATYKEGSENETRVYYPQSTQKHLESGWWSNFSIEDYTISCGQSIEFYFHNYSDATDNWHNWALYGASATHGASGYSEYFGIRCDNWDNTTGSNTGCTSDFNWDTFKDDMNGSLVHMTVSYDFDGVFTMTSTIKTTGDKTYNYSYTKTIASKPAELTLFFVNEKSYIDGSAIEAGVSEVLVGKRTTNGKMYNLFGAEVDETYKGIVIKYGKKYVNR